jgi:hypothetical protein
MKTLAETDDPTSLDILAAAYAETGQFSEAINRAAAARIGALDLGQHELAEAVNQRIELYKSNRPFRTGIGNASRNP